MMKTSIELDGNVASSHDYAYMNGGQKARGGAGKRIVVTSGDLDILKFTHDFRLLRIADIEVLTGRKYQRVHGRLKALFDHDYIGRISRPMRKDIYYIARPGLHVLLREGLISDDDALRRIREPELTDDGFLDHEILLAELHILLTLATRNAPIELVAWREGKENYDSFEITRNGSTERIAIEPDAFFTLRDTRRPEGRNTRSFLLEADRSTMPKKNRPGSRRFNDKICKYADYIDRGRPFEKYGIPSVRIVTVTLTALRRDGLIASAEELLTPAFHKYFLYGTLQDFSSSTPESIFDAVFLRPGDADGRHALMPPFAEQSASA